MQSRRVPAERSDHHADARCARQELLGHSDDLAGPRTNAPDRAIVQANGPNRHAITHVGDQTLAFLCGISPVSTASRPTTVHSNVQPRERGNASYLRCTPLRERTGLAKPTGRRSILIGELIWHPCVPANVFRHVVDWLAAVLDPGMSPKRVRSST